MRVLKVRYPAAHAVAIRGRRFLFKARLDVVVGVLGPFGFTQIFNDPLILGLIAHWPCLLGVINSSIMLRPSSREALPESAPAKRSFVLRPSSFLSQSGHPSSVPR